MLKKLLLLVSLGLIASCLSLSPASAQASRTWVSGVGDDANPCTRTAPCKTFAGAISKTAPSGEIDCLDPGGFGALTITKAITIDCTGTFGSVLVAGTNGINVSAGANDRVVIRGVKFDGFGSGIAGIQFNSGAQLSIDRCFIARFTGSAINVNATSTTQIYVTDTYITNASNGLSVASSSPQVLAVVSNSNIVNVANAAVTTSGAGGIAITVVNTRIAGATTGVFAGGSGTAIAIDGSSVEGTNTGLNAPVSGAAIRVSNNVIYGNSTNFAFAGGGVIASSGNNRVTPSGAQTPNATITQQ
jgi:hypothetical protein